MKKICSALTVTAFFSSILFIQGAGCSGPDGESRFENSKKSQDGTPAQVPEDLLANGESNAASTANDKEQEPLPGAASVDELKDKVLAAVKNSDTEELLSLYYLKGLNKELLEQFKPSLKYIASGETNFLAVFIIEASPDASPGYVQDKPLVWATPPTRRIVMVLPKVENPELGTLEVLGKSVLAAKVNGSWYLVCGREPSPDAREGVRLTHIDKYEGPSKNPWPTGGREKYEQLELHVSFSQVVTLLGKPDHHDEKGKGGSAESYTWEFWEGDINIGVTDDKVEWKANTFVNDPADPNKGRL